MRPFLRYWLPLLSWLIIIFLLSHQDGESSSRTSEWVLDILRWLNIDPEALRQSSFKLWVRKGAHMTEYFILYILIFRLLRQTHALRTTLWSSLLFCIAYAATDEFHQIYIPGRVGTILDVGIDSIGATIALLICWQYQRRKSTI